MCFLALGLDHSHVASLCGSAHVLRERHYLYVTPRLRMVNMLITLSG